MMGAGIAESDADGLRGFALSIPFHFNIGVDVCDRHAANPARANMPALIVEDARGQVQTITFARLKSGSDRMANVLRGLGIESGDRVAVYLSQRLETALALIAILKLGAVAVPLFPLFNGDGLGGRLTDSGAEVVVTDAEGAVRVMDLDLPTRPTVVSVDPDPPAGVRNLDDLMGRGSGYFRSVETMAEDPALLLYTSGTTGTPRGALLAHRALPAHWPGFGMAFPSPFLADELFWTPADWAWVGGLLSVLFPALSRGLPVLGCRGPRFDPEETLAMMSRHRVRSAFFPPTALRLLRQLPVAQVRASSPLRAVVAGGEPLGGALLDWGREALGLTINEVYGQTEANLVIGNGFPCHPVRPGSMGRVIPGHRVEIVDDEGRVLAPGELGEIAVARSDPSMFLGYWNNPEATAEKFRGEWMLTGDTGRKDSDGSFWFLGREDDVIISAGYRIGPGEVEDVLMRHPGVDQVAVVGIPDPERTEIVKAFVVPRDRGLLDNGTASGVLAQDLQQFARQRYGAHAYPRQVAFLGELPVSATGKIRRRDLRHLDPGQDL
ncbi:AMP-binding protein [Pararhodospirillum oryzae]|uniref:Acetyl-CoA synthetase n=1 Tax=Pararhodospirillum oryzae TaxID=478448 RepID=A0A512H5R3_9PROT|nr:AMP-binding protein [Pararhodospirillum oryzae]GEO80783.1 acetyl-CoA synthetase [Pararhodospirillum oryzae]